MTTTPITGSVTLPPRTLDEILTGSAVFHAKALVKGGAHDGMMIPITDGSITVDSSADVRRTGSISVAAVPEWVPDSPDHVLDVRSRTQIQIWQGVVDDTNVEHWWSQGVFYVVKTSEEESADGFSLGVELVDPSHRIKRSGIRRRWAASSSDHILESIIRVLHEVAPWAEIDIDLTGDIQFYNDAIIAEWGEDVWSKCREYARTLSRDLHVNRYGVIVAPPIVDPYSTEPVSMIGLTSRSLAIDADDVVNVVGCKWEEEKPEDAGTDWVGKGGVEEWVDHESSTRIEVFGPSTMDAGGDTSIVHTQGHAALTAQAQGITMLGLQQVAVGSKVQDPRDDVGMVTLIDGTPHVVSRLSFSIDGLSDTEIDFGGARPDVALRMAEFTKPRGEYRTTEIVTGLNPLRSRAVTDPSGASVTVQWTDALAGVEVGDPITVLHKGAGLRVGVALLVKKTLQQSNAGDSVATIGGVNTKVGDTVTVKAKVGTGSYATASGSGSQVTMDIPAPPVELTWSYNTQTMPTKYADASSATVTAINDNRHSLNSLIDVVAYINGRLVNLLNNNT